MQLFLKRLIDLLFSVVGLAFLLPFFLLMALLIKTDSKGGVFYRQLRVGKNGQDFYLYKFRSMYLDSDKKGLLTVGMKDSRVTKMGYFIRKYKLDELPQLINVLLGEMSLVGPRPEVKKYVALYSEEQLKVLSVKPGITDYASIAFSNENEILSNVEHPEEVYINEIMPAKLELNKKYIKEASLMIDLKIIGLTIFKILR